LIFFFFFFFFSKATFAADVLRELNRVRVDPVGYAREIEAFLKDDNGAFEGEKRFAHPRAVTPRVRMTLSEGKSAVKDLAQFLREEIDPRAPLESSDALDRVAMRLADDPKANSSPDKRLDAEGVTIRFGTMQEATSHGDSTPEEIVFLWLLGDGDSSRGIRKALLSSIFKQAGIATLKKGTGKRFNVISLANEVAEIGELPRREVFTKSGAMPAGPVPQRAPGGAAIAPAAVASTSSSTSSSTKNAFCSQCGKKSDNDDKFCAGCGSKL
jgi:hypothetical protein